LTSGAGSVSVEDMNWIEESDDPRTEKIAAVLVAQYGLDSADVWSLTNKIIAALDAEDEVTETTPPLPPKPTKLDGKRWWVSWYSESNAFALWFPWWISGFDSLDREIIVAAVIADTEEEAKEIVFSAYDNRPADIEWRFLNELPEEASPYSDRFRPADWHVWPE